MLEKIPKVWNKFYGGTSSDDKLTTGKQVVFSENMDLKSNSDFISITPASEQKVSTSGNLVLGFVDVTSSTGAKKTLGYGEDGVIYDIEGDSLEHTISGTDIITNAIEFNGFLYFMHEEVPIEGYICTKVPSSEAYEGNYTNAIAINLGTAEGVLVDNDTHTFPMYNYLGRQLYVASGTGLYKVDTLGVEEWVAVGTSDILDITQRGTTIKLFGKEGHITSIKTGSIIEESSVNSVIELGFPVTGALNHNGIDFIIGKEGEFGYMDGYQYTPISRPEKSELAGVNKFTFHGLWNATLSLGGQLFLVDTNDNQSSGHTLVSFGAKKQGFPECFEYSFNIAPNGTTIDVIGALGVPKIGKGFYYSYKYGTTTGVGYYKTYDNNTVLNMGTVYLDVFEGKEKNERKKIEEIQIYSRDTSESNRIFVEVNIDGGGYEALKTITTPGRFKFNPDNSFFDISFKIKSQNVTGSPKFYEIKLIYSIID